MISLSDRQLDIVTAAPALAEARKTRHLSATHRGDVEAARPRPFDNSDVTDAWRKH